jgi:transcriptional regulator with XRE-family HTH domain
MRGMTNERAGRLIAAVRIHLGLRQIDVARMAGVDQKVVSFLERGLFERVSITRIRRVCAALGIDFAVDLRYRGALGDRLLDRGHAALVERVVTELQTLGWIVRPEFTFNVYGDRGSVDILAWHPGRRALLIVEVKTRLGDLQALLMAMSKKVRVVPGVAADEMGWSRSAFARVVVMADTHANRSTVTAHAATFAATFPGRTVACRAWLKAPDGDFAGLWFLASRKDRPVKSVVARSGRDVRVRGVGKPLARQADAS